ncbi:ATP-dependent Clp protease proteolytic subunit [Allomesorhizobium camelthorni]|nr:ATP-dependent Clp protease proteolytic subunit [Mesorhizobium camelthorni]
MIPGATPAANSETPRRNLVMRYFARFDDGEVVRWAFRGLLIGAVGVLALDLRDLAETNGWSSPEAALTAPEPVLPPAVQTNAPTPSADPREFVTADEARLRQPMAFTLGAGGVMTAEGSIEPGSAARFAAEIEQRGEYVKTVSLNSPGGALDDAMAMAETVRELGIATVVADGALCASSCPLFFAGGKTRSAGEKAAIGVHQFYAATLSETAPEQAMADAQATTARISRHLSEMGIDPALWLHALDTPPRALYYLSPDELAEYKLVTKVSSVASK